MARQSKDKSAARSEIERNDAAHERALKEAFGVDREDARLYDLVLNTERLSIETCAKLVCDLAESPDLQETDLSRAILDDKGLGGAHAHQVGRTIYGWNGCQRD